jgi:L-serine dehydratase
MNISIFEVIGPIMIGPSSSHTAGAARLSWVARQIVGKKYHRVSFGLHGSFAKTYKGHGTDLALVAGALGMNADDERLKDSFTIAKEQGLSYDFYEVELNNVHSNTVQINFYMEDGTKREIIGSSIGGARIVIVKIDGFRIEYAALSNAIIIRQQDKKGTVSKVSGILAGYDINIGTMKLSRSNKGGEAFCIIETDQSIPQAVVTAIAAVGEVQHVQAINLEPI